MDTYSCRFCDSPHQDGLICTECGKSLCEETILLLNEKNDELKKHYEVCYKTLNETKRTFDTGSYKGIASKELISSLKMLPEPKKATSLDIICIASSISCAKLESFFQEDTKLGISLGDYVRNNILSVLDGQRAHHIELARLSKFRFILE